ncbi:helix-turn-helix domain-containing protein [Streptomyces sp. NPDC007856]|uniref:helix-turn-helix domain-containing protein n=1 Tax=Streptomyces sp. NPDC007856 TaxID=3364781 RepID=UPI0036D12234
MADESRELGELLLALKERSGRSYGALGKRLHVSTSTLHRYCNGTTVPNEYAPLERFARVCGATPDELVELHRRWILADAARRRVPEAGDRAENAVAGVGEASDTPLVTGTPLAAEAPAPAQAGSDPAPTAALPAPAARPRRRRSALVAAVAAAVTVSAAVVAVAAQSGSDTGGRRGSTAHAAGGPGATRHGVTASGRAPAGTSAPPSGKSPSPSADARSSAGTAADADVSSGGGTPGAGTTPPFHVNVLTNNWDMPCDQWFLVQRPPGSVPPPPASQATGGWAAAEGAVPAGHLRLQVTVQGSNSRPVVLHALRVVTTSTGAAPRGNAYTMGSQCGGGLTPSSFAVDLDAPSPNARPVPGDEGSATNFPYKVSVDDPEVLNIDASTDGHDVTWYLELSWSSGDQQGTARIDDHGKPFRTVAMKGDKAYWYNADGADEWQPYTPPTTG